VTPALEGALAAARSALGRLRALRRCGETRFAFVVSGYMPEERVPALRAAAAATFGDHVAVLARPPTPREWPDVPVVLRNARWLRPFQLLLALVPLPRYGSIDPTPWLALFYPLLLGVVLGDVALGALGVVVALVLRLRKVGGAVGADVAWVALWCSVSVALFGLAYGEALGDLGARYGLRPLLLDRRNATMVFLGMALAVGAVHVGTGIALGVVVAARGGHGREAAARAAKLAMLVAGAAAGAALAGALPRGAVGPALLAGGVALVGAVIAEGPMAALDVVLGLGNVLSYARLMALGLAAVMLAEVATMIARTLEPAALGLAIGVMLHAVNCSLGLISPMIAALRLHYVEFFEKFYDEGGEPYRPFALAA
jgi:V/A-type H+-transporting ATPase subunit I